MSDLVTLNELKEYINKKTDAIMVDLDIISSFVHDEKHKKSIFNSNTTLDEVLERCQLFADFQQRFGYAKGRLDAYKDFADKFDL